MNKKEIYDKLPQEVKDILFQSEGWLVGSSVGNLSEEREVRDYDILITDSKLFAKATSGLSYYFNRFTTFGRINLDVNGVSIDIWHQSLEDFIHLAFDCGVMYNMSKGIILERNKV